MTAKLDPLADVIPPKAPALDLAQFGGHTPGPWIVGSETRVYMGAAMEKREIAVATKADPTERHKAKANASLIAAAPALLALARGQQARAKAHAVLAEEENS